MTEPVHPRRALVTGGSGDLGEAICHALAEGGYRVITRAPASTTTRRWPAWRAA